MLYTFGGLWVDNDAELKVPIAEWIKHSELNWNKHRFVTGMECNGCNDINLQAIQYAFMSVPKHPILYDLITQIAVNAYKKQSFFEHFGHLNKVIHKTGPGVFTDAIIGYIIQNGYKPSDITPHGIAGDVYVMPWWLWGYMKQGDDVPSKPNDTSLPATPFIIHKFAASWVGK